MTRAPQMRAVCTNGCSGIEVAYRRRFHTVFAAYASFGAMAAQMVKVRGTAHQEQGTVVS